MTLKKRGSFSKKRRTRVFLKRNDFFRSRQIMSHLMIALILSSRRGGFVSQLACIINRIYHKSKIITLRGWFRIISRVYPTSTRIDDFHLLASEESAPRIAKIG